MLIKCVLQEKTEKQTEAFQKLLQQRLQHKFKYSVRFNEMIFLLLTVTCVVLSKDTTRNAGSGRAEEV